MSIISAVYLIHNKVNNKKYVGITNNFYRRKQEHLFRLRRNKHANYKVQRDYNKYGELNIEFTILQFLDITMDRFSEERKWIKHLSPEYNITGKPTRKHIKRKISKSNYKTYSGIVSPSGIIYTPIIGMKEFCIKHGLCYSSIVSLMTQKRNEYKGWTRYNPD